MSDTDMELLARYTRQHAVARTAKIYVGDHESPLRERASHSSSLATFAVCCLTGR